MVSGMTGAGGNVGAVITQVIFFRGSQFTTQDGISYMGIMIVAISFSIAAIYFPQWGGMFCGPKQDFTERKYYLEEWDSKEQEQDLHLVSMTFAETCKNERSNKGKSKPEEESTGNHV